jgi:putative membrane protein
LSNIRLELPVYKITGAAMLRIAKLFIFITIIIFGIAIHLRNDQVVSLDVYLGTVELPFSVFLAGTFIVGAILGVLATLPTILKLGREKSRLLTQIRLSEKELDTLRVIPLKD